MSLDEKSCTTEEVEHRALTDAEIEGVAGAGLWEYLLKQLGKAVDELTTVKPRL